MAASCRPTSTPLASHRPAPSGVVAGERPAGPGNAIIERLTIMDKWRTAKNSTIVRISASAATLVAVAATVGAGWKWF